MSQATRVQRQFVQYHERVLATNPIAYWPLNEKQGNVAYDWVSGRVTGAQNGAYTGVTLAQPGIGDGNTCPLYDGANDYCNVLTAAFTGALDGSEGTLAAWSRVSGGGVWTDGVDRFSVGFTDGAFANRIWLYKFGNNNMRCLYRAGGVDKFVNAATTATGWFYLAMTWSASADEMKGYYNGAQSGVTQNGLGVWGAVPVLAIIGAQTLVPNTPWSGWLAHCAVWNRALAPGEIAALATL